MNQDRYPDMYMRSGNINMGSPLCDAPWDVSPMRYQDNVKGECIDHETVITDVELAHAYVPIQNMCDTFTPLTALKKGTIFPSLVNVYGWERKSRGGMRYE